MRYEPEHAAKAFEVMERLYPLVSPQDEYVELLAILREPRRWQEAHAAFERIRVNLTLPAEMQKKQGLDSVFVYVAENAAKTAYNCSGGSAPFDKDSFEWLLKSASQFNEAFIAIQAQPVAPADAFAAR